MAEIDEELSREVSTGHGEKKSESIAVFCSREAVKAGVGSNMGGPFNPYSIFTSVRMNLISHCAASTK